jgi:hypothetical protein
MAEPAVRSLLNEIEHGVQVVSCASRVISVPAKTAFYISDKTEEIRSHNCINMVADLRELVSIGSMGMDFLVTIFVASPRKLVEGALYSQGPTIRVRAVLDQTRICTHYPVRPRSTVRPGYVI